MNVAVIGAGGIGSPLVRGLVELPWVDQIWVVDGDQVERSNLPRQPWYDEASIGSKKAETLAQVFGARVHPMAVRVDRTFPWPPCDLLFDAPDNWPARLAIAEAARSQAIPWIFASAVRWEGQSALMRPDGPCLRCLFGEELLEGPRCFEAGVVGFVTLAVAGQALELADRWVRQPADSALDRLYLLEGREGALWSVGLPKARCSHGIVQ